MPAAHDRTPFTDWPRPRAVPLGHLDPAAPLDDFAGAGPGLAVADLRPAPAAGLPGPDRIRMQGVQVHTPVLDAFGGVLHVPTSTTTDLEKP